MANEEIERAEKVDSENRLSVTQMIADAVAAEREACAAICDTGATYGLTKQRREGAAHCASIIRSRPTP